MTRKCPSCAAENRVPWERYGDVAKCGKCKAELPPPDRPLDVGERELDEILAKAKVPVLVDFWAPWCPPCRLAGPQVEKALGALGREAIVVKVDTQAHPKLGARFGVDAIPHFVVLMNGKPIASHTGLLKAADLVALVRTAGAHAA